MIKFTLDYSSGMPIYRQIIDQIRFGIASGQLKLGEQLPTVRALAVELKVNLNTVSKAYKELEIKNILETQQGTLLVGFPQIKTMPVELYGVIMQYPITAGPVLSLLLIIPTIVILVALRKYVGPEAIAKGYNMK